MAQAEAAEKELATEAAAAASKKSKKAPPPLAMSAESEAACVRAMLEWCSVGLPGGSDGTSAGSGARRIVPFRGPQRSAAVGSIQSAGRGASLASSDRSSPRAAAIRNRRIDSFRGPIASFSQPPARPFRRVGRGEGPPVLY
eukprot:8334365-Pyramimonas_sp.AAC.2